MKSTQPELTATPVPLGTPLMMGWPVLCPLSPARLIELVPTLDQYTCVELTAMAPG